MLDLEAIETQLARAKAYPRDNQLVAIVNLADAYFEPLIARVRELEAPLPVAPALTRDSLPRSYLSKNGNLAFVCTLCDDDQPRGNLRMMAHLTEHGIDGLVAANQLSNAAYYAGLDRVVETP